jgi:hypothetical protein
MVYPQPKVFVETQPDEDCHGHVLVGTAIALLIEAVLIVAGMLVYEWWV